MNSAKLQRIMQEAADRTASRAAGQTQLRVKEGIVLTDRIRSGRMLDGIEVREVGPAKFQVRSDVPYVQYQEHGRGPVRPIRAKALRFRPKGSSGFVFAKFVRADPGGHFFKRALSLLGLRDWTG